MPDGAIGAVTDHRLANASRIRATPLASLKLIFFTGLWCNSSTSRCERDSPGANPGVLTNEMEVGPGNVRQERARFFTQSE
jgi:hypothetical protein